VALSATAVAATKLSTGQVKAVNIASEAVTNPKIKKLAVTNPKLGKESVTSGKIKNLGITNPKLGKESVTTGKLKKKAVTAAILGPEAVTGGKLGNESVSSGKLAVSLYSQLLKNVTYVTASSGPQSDTERTVIAFCPAGKEVLGGGVRITGASTKVVPIESAPEFNVAGARIGWSAAGRELSSETENWTIQAYAICAEL
jgi:hypothetical protein